MSDSTEAKDGKSQGGILKRGADAVKDLREIAETISSAWTAIAKKVRPDYVAAARGFQLISKDGAGYARNLVEFFAPYRIRALARECHATLVAVDETLFPGF
jgi:hypothetical protein